MQDIYIRGGQIIDGSGAPAYRADLLIRDGRIAAIGEGLDPQDAIVLDASGACVTPGFIDSHTHFDPGMFWEPLAEMAQHGVTTVLIGNCSLGLAPLKAESRTALVDLFSFIEDIPKQVLEGMVPFDWETYAEYVVSMKAQDCAVNVVSLVSHSMLRDYVMGAAAWERAADEREIEAIALELDKALTAGARGMSTSFFDKDSQGRNVPSFHASDAEFDRLFETLARHGAVAQMIPRHPDLEAVSEDLLRLGAFAARHQVPLFSNAIGETPTNPETPAALLDVARRIRGLGATFYHMLSPRSIELSVNFDQTMTFMSMPVWNAMIQTDRATKRHLLASPEWREKARHEWDTVRSYLFPTDDIGRIRIIAVGREENAPWLGRSLADLVADRKGHPSDVLADWLLENDIETALVVPMSNIDYDKVGELSCEPEVLISGSDAGAHLQMFCAVGDSTLFLTRHVRDMKHMPLERAVHKLTAEQAQFLGLKERGLLKPGYWADVTVFALDEIEWLPEESRNDLPGGLGRFARPPGNYRFTIVNGTIVQAAGKDTGARSAEFLGAGAAKPDPIAAIS